MISATQFEHLMEDSGFYPQEDEKDADIEKNIEEESRYFTGDA